MKIPRPYLKNQSSDNMGTADPYAFKHVGSFCIILFLAVFRPAALWPEISVSTAPLAVLAAWLLLFYKISITLGYRVFVQQHKTLILLIAGYFLLCGTSLLVNYYRYPDIGSFARWGLAFPIIQSALVACGFLFSLPQNTRGASVSRMRGNALPITLIALVIPAITFWQNFDNESAFQIYQYTVGGDLPREDSTKRSIFATSTDLGAISALICMAALMIVIARFQIRDWRWTTAALILLLLNGISGSLSGSRGFFLSMGLGLLTLVSIWLRHHLALLLMALPALVSVLILALQFAPIGASLKLAPVASFFLSSKIGIPIQPSDLEFNLTSAALGLRADLWQRAAEQTLAYPLLGITNGGYRLLNESLGITPIHNVHNAFLQLGVDAGVGGILLGLSAVVVLLLRSRSNPRVILIVAALSTLLAENFTDHSLSWIAVSSFTLANCASPRLGLREGQTNAQWVGLGLLTVMIAASLTFTATYKKQREKFESMKLSEQINALQPYYLGDYWNDPPVLISKNLRDTLGDTRREGNLILYDDIALGAVCAYAYEGARLLHLSNEVRGIELGKTLAAANQWALTLLTDSACISRQRSPVNLGDWISNFNYFSPSEGSYSNQKQLRLVTDHIGFFTPIFDANQNQLLKITATGRDVGGNSPKLMITFYDPKTGDVVLETNFSVTSKIQIISTELPSTLSGMGYLRFRLRDWREDTDLGTQQEVKVTKFDLYRGE